MAYADVAVPGDAQRGSGALKWRESVAVRCRWARIRSITWTWVMNAMMGISWPQRWEGELSS